MKFLLASLALACTFVLLGPAHAVPAGMKVEFTGSAMGKVTFDGTAHAGTGRACGECHVGIFEMSRSAKVSMADHTGNQYCFTCHNGERAFAAPDNCTTCHKH